MARAGGRRTRKHRPFWVEFPLLV
ncbi:signal peptidase I, partial [Streptomyces sp. ZEA17I]